MLKNIIIILSVILNLVFIPAFIVDYTAQEEEENLFNTHSYGMMMKSQYLKKVALSSLKRLVVTLYG
jgi:hypothetical protein